MICRALESHDVPRAVDAMLEAGANLGGLSSRGALAALCREAVRPAARLPVLVVVAVEDGEVAGYVASVTEWNRFWRGFLLRHPGLAAELTWRRARRTLRRRRRVGVKAAAAMHDVEAARAVDAYERDDTRSWRDRAPDIAKMLHIGVRPAWRGRGVSRQLYAELLPRLRRMNIRRVDGCPGAANVATLRLHQQLGWRITRTADGLLATLDLTAAT